MSYAPWPGQAHRRKVWRWAACSLPLPLLIALNPSPEARASASPDEICRTKAIPADTIWSCRSPNPPSTTIFWEPPCGTGNLTAQVTAPNMTFVVSNVDRNRFLTVRGNATSADILVGSPNGNDVLFGQGGRNTFVMGGLNGFVLGVGDSTFYGTTSRESDWSILTSSSTEYVFINSPAQANPGLINTAANPWPASPTAVRGSAALGSTRAPCLSPKLLQLPESRAPRLAQLNQDLPVPCFLECQKKTKLRYLTPFPGTASLVGFKAEGKAQTRILLPADQFLFQGRSLEGLERIPVLQVEGVRFLPAEEVSEEKRKQLIEQAKGLQGVRSDEAPLVYFRNNGLLVFSYNGQPLGSQANPGRVIARLLDANGRPVVLRPRLKQRYYQTGFVLFAPTPSEQQPDPDVPR